MTFHPHPLETRSAPDDDAGDLHEATRAVEELRTAAEQFRADLETRLDERVDSITGRIDTLETRLSRPNVQTGRDDDLERRAFAAYLRHGSTAPAEEIRALTVSDDSQGGYLAPPEMVNEFVRDLVEFSPIRSIASVRTITAPSVRYPRRTSITNAKWEGEGEESPGSQPAFGMLDIPAHRLTTHVDVSNELLADSAGAAEQEVRLALAEDFGAKEGTAFVNGTGAGQPEGLMVNPSIAETINGHASNLSADKLIDLMYALPAAYRNAGTWTMNGSTLAAVRKLKDGDGRFLWQPSYQAGQPETILGRPVIEAVDMPDIAGGAFPILFGDFAQYRIVDRIALAILADPYSQATRNMTRMHATRRVGARVLQPAAFRKLKMAAS